MCVFASTTKSPWNVYKYKYIYILVNYLTNLGFSDISGIPIPLTFTTSHTRRVHHFNSPESRATDEVTELLLCAVWKHCTHCHWLITFSTTQLIVKNLKNHIFTIHFPKIQCYLERFVLWPNTLAKNKLSNLIVKDHSSWQLSNALHAFRSRPLTQFYQPTR